MERKKMEGCGELQGNFMFAYAFPTRLMGGGATPFVHYTHPQNLLPEYRGAVTASAGSAMNFGRSASSFVTDDRRHFSNVASSLSSWIPEDGNRSIDRRCLYGQEGKPRETERNQRIHKKRRLVWDKDLEERFEAALETLGSENAVPSKILKIMNIPHLTRDNIASHLQKYRRDRRKRYQTSHQGIDQPLKDEEIDDIISSFYSRKPRETSEAHLEIFEEFQVEDLLC